MPKTATLNLRIDPKLKSVAMKAAHDDGRTITNQIEKLLSDYLRKHGYKVEGR